jgi:hypothetical protein
LGRRGTGDGDQAGNDSNLNHFHVILPTFKALARPNSIPSATAPPSQIVMACSNVAVGSNPVMAVMSAT